jgi:hypothetical protein
MPAIPILPSTLPSLMFRFEYRDGHVAVDDAEQNQHQHPSACPPVDRHPACSLLKLGRQGKRLDDSDYDQKERKDNIIKSETDPFGVHQLIGEGIDPGKAGYPFELHKKGGSAGNQQHIEPAQRIDGSEATPARHAV